MPRGAVSLICTFQAVTGNSVTGGHSSICTSFSLHKGMQGQNFFYVSVCECVCVCVCVCVLYSSASRAAWLQPGGSDCPGLILSMSL